MDLRSAHVLITGASGGLGAALAEAFAERGAELTLSGRRAEELHRLAAAVGGRAVPADLADPAAPESLLSQCGPIDVLVAAAAVPASGLLWEYSTEEMDRALTVNLRAPVLLAKLAAESMRERGTGGHVVFLSSLSGRSASARMALYNATKFGLRGFALALREDLRPYGIGVSSVLPGPVRDAGMFADSGVHVPRAATRTAAQVARATVRAVEANRGEVVVAPLALRAATTLGALAPGVSAALARRTGNDAMMAAVSEGQRRKR
ncbi:oxidoreductase [Tsukamurella pulmonis]|uniref:SDR family NAD(P)-dependent oxidoreductase n=1 Tax=Tsukamurella pulmonis TaxID=47312 RepID=UPI0007955FB0|nr:SDR family NAD(P)-dependent oxidoreductase [Tsukamurella pulmonis]KXP11230.1 oxidoreductase [Tsukamurella pulmonis]RDH12863.1 SDR family NAD(P)-dependent oxidoreductase [Tsukamurella pulmonis]